MFWIRQKLPAHFTLTAVLFLLLVQPSFSQKSYTSKDSIRIYDLLDKADEVSDVNVDSAMHFARSAFQLSRQKKMLRGEGWALLKIAELKKHLTKQDSIELLDFEGLKIAGLLHDDFMQALAYLQLGQHYMFKNRYGESEIQYKKSLAAKFEKDQSEYTALVYNDLGSLFRLKEDYEKEIEWLLKARRLADELNDPTTSAFTLSNLANAFYNLGKPKEATQYLRQAIALRQQSGDVIGLARNYNSMSRILLNDSLQASLKYQQMAMKYAEQSKAKSVIAASYSSMATLLNKEMKNKEALEYEKKSIAIFRELQDKNQEAYRSISAAILSATLNDSAQTLSFFQNAFDLSSQIKSKANIRDVYFHRALYFKDRKDYYNTYENFKNYVSYKDSLIREETQSNIAELQLKYETEKKDNEINLLNIDKKIRQLEIEKQKATIRGNLYEAQQKEKAITILSQEKELQRVKLKQQKEEIDRQFLLAKNNEQKIRLLNQEQLLKNNKIENQEIIQKSIIALTALLLLTFGILFNRYQLKKKIEAQQVLVNFRNDVAKDLHDDIGSTLTSIKILSEVSKNNLVKDQQKAGTYLDKIKEQSVNMQQEMSDIVWAIKPDNDKLANMLVRMREFVNHTLEPKNIHADFVVNDEALSSSLDMQQRRDFFLIFKEAINNATKYSNASVVRILLQKADGEIHLEISDNGTGFETGRETSSNGLKNMKSRALALNGTITISSSKNLGTRIALSVPIA